MSGSLYKVKELLSSKEFSGLDAKTKKLIMLYYDEKLYITERRGCNNIFITSYSKNGEFILSALDDAIKEYNNINTSARYTDDFPAKHKNFLSSYEFRKMYSRNSFRNNLICNLDSIINIHCGHWIDHMDVERVGDGEFKKCPI